jgi:hypothetical protein
MSEREAQLIFETLKGQSQFAYFQLGVAASAIAFAVHETAGVSLADAPWPLGLGVGLWGFSFALGCFGLDARENALHHNINFLKEITNIPPQLKTGQINQAIDEFRDSVGERFERAGRRFRWQKWVLFAGALAYIAGHMMMMAATPPKARTTAESPLRR